jgi:hypothetical protein
MEEKTEQKFGSGKNQQNFLASFPKQNNQRPTLLRSGMKKRTSLLTLKKQR